MKKIIITIMAMVLSLIMSIDVGASGVTETIEKVEVNETVAVNEVVDISAATNIGEILTDTDAEELSDSEDTTEPNIVGESDGSLIQESMSLSEMVLAIAESLGVSVGEAEQIVSNIRTIGDKYLGESDLWPYIAEDMDAYPAKWTIIGMIFALVLFLIGLLIKRVISDATTMLKMRVALSNIDSALNGDEKDENGNALSIRAMINEKNGHIELLEKENEALQGKAAELTKTVELLNNAISKIEADSSTALRITEESALQILQLLNIALDRKVPITSKEAREIWYSSTQNKIKSIYEEGVSNVGEDTKEI